LSVAVGVLCVASGALFASAGAATTVKHTAKRSVSPILSISPAYYAGDQLVTGGGTVSGASHRGTAHGGGHIAHVTRLPARRGGYGGGDYLGELGGITRWEPGKNIRVYVAPGRSSFKSIVANAMNQWSHASGGAFHWSLVGDPGSADYTISWSGTQHEVSTGTEAGLTTTDTMPNDDGSETIAKAHTRILTRLDGYPLPDREIAETVLHEIGHGLGLDGHSSNPRDIMFYAAAQGQGGLTARDMNTLQKLYRQ
jgi:hypothetical protein